ncbi:interferon-induced protein 44-like [Mercenaria mercenaria]|uniref:interferon-induced protein 44-like n=1 Tax=Mercenaria mercenaria TaxID=6596 RepID=UPI00234E3E89|nr:interferon-induced protein 44-like [Mercenaria mercenaria]
MGVEDNDQGGLNLNDVLYLVKGHIPPDYKFNPATPIDERSPEFRPEPKDNEKIHCVVFVLDATVAGNDNISDARRRKIKELLTALKAFNIPRIVLLTKIDVLCEFVDADIENTYKSEKVKEAVNVAKELYKLPENCVFPVRNYEREVEADYKKEILHLLALKQMFNFGAIFQTVCRFIKTPDVGTVKARLQDNVV